jgi:hypothetical protein
MSDPSFDERYGAGAHERAVRLLSQPCVSFASIAGIFGVTRECVRQWHRTLLPEAPTGRERQRLCRERRQRQALLRDRTFAAFYRHAQPVLAQFGLGLVPTCTTGYRKRLIRLGDSLVFLKAARASRRSGDTAAEYVLTPYRGPADFIYYRLSDDDFLLVPRREVPASGTSFVDGPSSRYQPYRNSFDVLHAGVTVRRATAAALRHAAR